MTQEEWIQSVAKNAKNAPDPLKFWVIRSIFALF